MISIYLAMRSKPKIKWGKHNTTSYSLIWPVLDFSYKALLRPVYINSTALNNSRKN